MSSISMNNHMERWMDPHYPITLYTHLPDQPTITQGSGKMPNLRRLNLFHSHGMKLEMRQRWVWKKKTFHLCELIVWSDTLTTLFYKRNVQVLITFPRSRGQGTSNIKIQPWPSLLSVYHLIWCGWKSWKKTYWRGTDWDRYRAGSGNPVMWLLWTLTGFSSNSQQLGWRGQGNPVVLKAIQTVGPSVVSHPLT